MVKLDEGAVIIEPWDPMCEEKQIDIDSKTLEANVADVGAPFSPNPASPGKEKKDDR